MLLDLTIDLVEQGRFQRPRRRQDLAVTARRFVAGGEIIKELGEIGADVIVAGQEAGSE